MYIKKKRVKVVFKGKGDLMKDAYPASCVGAYSMKETLPEFVPALAMTA